MRHTHTHAYSRILRYSIFIMAKRTTVEVREAAVIRVRELRMQEKEMYLADSKLRDAHDDSFRPQFDAILAVRHELVDLGVDLLIKRAVHSDGHDESFSARFSEMLAVRHEIVDLVGDMVMKRGVDSDQFTVERLQELKVLDKKLKNAHDAETLIARLQVVDLGDVQKKRGVQTDLIAVNERTKVLKALNTKLYQEFQSEKKPGDDDVKERNLARGEITSYADRLEIQLGLDELNEDVL